LTVGYGDDTVAIVLYTICFALSIDSYIYQKLQIKGKKMKKISIVVAAVIVAGVLFGAGFMAGRPPRATPFVMGEIVERTGMHNPYSLVSASELPELMERDDVIVVDFSAAPNQVIPGAVWINRALLLQTVVGDPMRLGTLEAHEMVLGHHGISNDHTIIVYCNQNNLWAARFFWQMRAFGHERVRLLDGGTAAWLAAGGIVNDGAGPARAPVEFRAVNRVGFINADLPDVLDAKHNPNWAILDVRSPGEWNAGRIPSAIQVTYPVDLLNPDGTFRSVEELTALVAHIPDNQRIIVYCLGGVRAANMWFVLTEVLGWPQRVLNYDGSWNDYSISGHPIETN